MTIRGRQTRLQARAGELLPELRGVQQQLLAGGGVGVAICLVGLFLNPAQFIRSYLPAYMLVLGVTLGCLALGMVHQVSGGAWGVVIRRLIGAAARTLPALTLLFLPIVCGMRALYPWTHPEVVAHDEALQWKQPYLNVPFFILRAAIYFAAWNGISYVLNRWAVEQDQTGDPRYARKMQLVSAGGLVAYGLTITFASFDWMMSLEPHWFSTIYGVLVMGGQGLAGMAFAIVVLERLSRRPPLRDLVTSSHFHDLGNLLLAFVMLWTYFSFSQFLIIWSGNLPEEAEWYLRPHGRRLVARGARADPVPLRRAVPAAAVARAEAQPGIAGAHRDPGARHALRRSVLADGPAVSSRRRARPLAGPRAAGVDRRGVAGPLRPSSAAPFARAGARPRVRRGGRTGGGARGAEVVTTRETGSAEHENPAQAHEESDVNVRAVLGFGLGLLVAGAAIYVLVGLLFGYYTREASKARRVYPLAAYQQGQLPPQPRLQTHPREDMRELRRREDAVLGSYGWVDRDAGIARIPIDEAMKLTVQRGLPTR